MWSIKHLPAPETSLLVTSSKHGETDYKSTLKFIEAVKATNKTRIASIILDSGGHNFNTWKREIPPGAAVDERAPDGPLKMILKGWPRACGEASKRALNSASPVPPGGRPEPLTFR